MGACAIVKKSVIRANTLPFTQHLLDTLGLFRTVLVYDYCLNIMIFCLLKREKERKNSNLSTAGGSFS